MGNSNAQNNNPLLCDTETGICEINRNDLSSKSINTATTHKPIKLIYFTDPICSSCWGIEPQLRKLKLEYGHVLELEYRMGGLLPNWNYNSGGISKPSDVAHHWDEMSQYYDMPIDGGVWIEDPLYSSYPPSIAFKAAEMESQEKAVVFLRKLRELVFLKKKNISKWDSIVEAAHKVDLDIEKLKQNYNGEGRNLFEEDLALAQRFGVRGFPTMIFVDRFGMQERVYGSKPYQVFENTLLKLQPSVHKLTYNTNWLDLFQHYPTLTSREFAELSGMERRASELFLQNLHENGKLLKLQIKSGTLWILHS